MSIVWSCCLRQFRRVHISAACIHVPNGTQRRVYQRCHTVRAGTIDVDNSTSTRDRISNQQEDVFTPACTNPVDLIADTGPETDSAVIASTESNTDDLVEETVHDADSELMTVKVGNAWLPSRSASLAPYIGVSRTLSTLVMMGVNLSEIDKQPEAANYLVKLDLERDMKPFILFLSQLGLDGKEVASVITHSPGIFQESLDNLQVRINYLESKLFTREQIAHIISRAKGFLLQTTKDTDRQLGYLQKEFKLTGAEVREIVAKHPRITVCDREKIKWNKFALKDILEFTDNELKLLLIAQPRIYREGKEALMHRFQYLHDEMGLTHAQILDCPTVLLTREFILKERHQFLKLLGRVQLDPKKEHYTSSESLVSGSDEEFCEKVAKVSLEDYEEFLKTL